LLVVIGIGSLIYFRPRPVPTSRTALGRVSTLAGNGSPEVKDGPSLSASFGDPFGIAVDRDGSVIVAEGGASNRIRRITPESQVETLAGSVEGFADGPAASAAFNTPSGIALDGDDALIIADTSNNRIRRLTPDGHVSTVAGSGVQGYQDGPAAEAQFDTPIGVAVDHQGNIFVADSFNDRIRKISPDGLVSTVAGGGTPGFRAGPAATALFDTPCGIAVDETGNLFVADTGNHAIRKITPQGQVITMAGGAEGHADGKGQDAGFDYPTGIAITRDGFLFVTDAGSGRIRRITPEADVTTFAGRRLGFADGIGQQARFSSPSGIAVDREGNVYVADTMNFLIRRISAVAPESAATSASAEPEPFIQPPGGSTGSVQPPGGSTGSVSDRVSASTSHANPGSIIPRLSVHLFRIGSTFPWPLNPQDQWHEVTGVMGEPRGWPGGGPLDHLHSGLDIRGAMGESVVSVVDEKVSSPIAAWNFGEANEGIQIGLMSYFHLRIGRNGKNEIQAPEKFKPVLNEAGELVGVRVRRGARFGVGDVIGTVNQLYHVHLDFGPWYAPANPLQFPFDDFKDTIPPIIEPGGIEIASSAGEPFKKKRDGRLVVSGDVDIVVTAYDQADGNARRRRLGLYKVGYQILNEDGTPAKGFEEPLINIEFDRLPFDNEAIFLVYAPGSGVSAYGTPTKFKYIVTNRVRGGAARDGLLRAPLLAPGNYILKVIAEDYAGNRASGRSTELPITVEMNP
jgi:sugar lactone lactonase YvrE